MALVPRGYVGSQLVPLLIVGGCPSQLPTKGSWRSGGPLEYGVGPHPTLLPLPGVRLVTTLLITIVNYYTH